MSSVRISTFDRNVLLRLLPLNERKRLAQNAEIMTLNPEDTLFGVGSETSALIFPLDVTTLSLRIPLNDGRTIEAVTVGREGVYGLILPSGLITSS